MLSRTLLIVPGSMTGSGGRKKSSFQSKFGLGRVQISKSRFIHLWIASPTRLLPIGAQHFGWLPPFLRMSTSLRGPSFPRPGLRLRRESDKVERDKVGVSPPAGCDASGDGFSRASASAFGTLKGKWCLEKGNGMRRHVYERKVLAWQLGSS